MKWSERADAWEEALARAIKTWVANVRAQPVPLLVGIAWFALTFTATVWVGGGLNPKVFASPDEALNRFAAGVLSKQGHPFLALPFPDPEDLAHPRHWVTIGDHAAPSYAPVAIYAYATFLWLHGLRWVSVLPALAAGAFALGTAKLLPRGRQWLALPSPLLAFPAIYWLTRPWMNLSVLLICVCWAFYFWASWLRTQRPLYLTLAVSLVGAAAAVRPDYAAYLMMITLLLGLAQASEQWRRVVVLVLAAGSGAVAVNLLLNWLVTGHPTIAAYQIVAARDEGTSASAGPLVLLRQLLIPMGIPTHQTALRFLAKYWVKMGPIAGLLLGQLALIPLLWKQRRHEAALHVIALCVIFGFVLSRMDPDLNGAVERVGASHHSMPRYWAPVYLLATVPPVLFLSRLKNRWLFLVGALLLSGLALRSGYQIAKKERSSFIRMRAFLDRSTAAVEPLQRQVPDGAMVYSIGYDKILWPYWRIGTIDEPEPTAASMRRAVDTGHDVWVYETGFGRTRYKILVRALAEQKLVLVRLRTRGLYHLKRKP